MPRLVTIAQVVRSVENWPEVVSIKLGLGTRELGIISFRSGLQVCLRRRSRDWDIIRDLFVKGGYARSMELLRGTNQRGAVVDLGGNIGCFSILAAMQSALLEVHAFEPGPENVRIFGMNMAANRDLGHRIHLQDDAVAGAEGTAVWHFDAANAGRSSIYGRAAAGHTVRVRSFHDVLRSITRPIALVKIDIEGAEYDLLRETPAEAWSVVPALTIEVHDDPKNQWSRTRVRSELTNLGYRIEVDDQFAWFCHR